MENETLGDWKHFSQKFTVERKRNRIQKIIDTLLRRQYSVEIEINFAYLGDVEPDVIISGFYISAQKGEKNIVDL